MKLDDLLEGRLGFLIGLCIGIGGTLLVRAVASTGAPSGSANPDPAEMTVKQIEAWLAETGDADAIGALLEAERSGPGRKTAIEAIERRLTAVVG